MYVCNLYVKLSNMVSKTNHPVSTLLHDFITHKLLLLRMGIRMGMRITGMGMRTDIKMGRTGIRTTMYMYFI